VARVGHGRVTRSRCAGGRAVHPPSRRATLTAMSSRVVAVLIASGFLLAVPACSDEGQHGHMGGGGSTATPTADRCEGIATCGACTPVLGCGWCAYDDGTGACVSGPNRCRGDSFRWTWEPAGCSSPVDGGPATDTGIVVHDADASPADAEPVDVGPADSAPVDAAPADAAPADAAPVDAAPADTGTEVASDGGLPLCVAPDKGLGGCVATTGGSMCTPSQYAVGCHASGSSSIPAPDSSLGCKVVPLPTPPGSLFYCCPCR
jgi:hypothetical protein